MSITCTVHGARKAVFEHIFGTNTVPVLSAYPALANLPNIGQREVYLLDLAQITPSQRQNLVAYLADTFDLPIAEVETDLERIGMPVLADECTLMVSGDAARRFNTESLEQPYFDDGDFDAYDPDSGVYEDHLGDPAGGENARFLDWRDLEA